MCLWLSSRPKTLPCVHRLYEKDELFDLQRDPGEQNNLIDDPAMNDVLALLRQRLLKWYMETCDVVPRQTDRR